jgi:hypothetical protein
MDKKASKFVKAAKSSLNKAKRTYICRSLKDVIKAYRACTTSAEERALVKKESAHIRDLFKEGDTAFRRINITKLLFFHMNGYPTDFGMTECIKLCASSKFADKRVAYLGLMIIVDETEDILMLITNCLKQDLASQDANVVALALTVLGNMASAEMVRDLLPEIEKHLTSSNIYLRKKAALASVRAVRKLPCEETANILVTVPLLFESRSSAAYVAGTALAVSLAKQDPANLSELRRSTFPAATAVLRDLLIPMGRTNERGATIGGTRNSFTQVRVLTALRFIASGDGFDGLDLLLDLLAQVASNTESSKLIGTAVLYECVRTVLAVRAGEALHGLALTIMGQFLGHKDANVRYVALQELVKAVAVGLRGSSLENYQGKILECLQEPDPTIRKRAVELLHAIASASNVAKFSEDLLAFLTRSEEEDLRELACRRVVNMATAYAPSKEWHVDVFMRALEIVDMSMPEGLVSEFLVMISAEPGVQAYAARLVYDRVLCHEKNSENGLDPFESPATGQSYENPQNSERRESTGRTSKRKPRLELVAVSIFGEYGDFLVKGSKDSTEPHALSASDAISCIGRILGASGVGVGTLSTSSMPTDSRDDAVGLEISLVREASMSALVKLATRLAYKSMSSRPVHDVHGFLGVEGSRNGKQLALTNRSSPLTMSTALVPSLTDGNVGGLGTDMLASLGITDKHATATENSDKRIHVDRALGLPRSILDEEEDGSTIIADGDTDPIVLRVRETLSRYRQSMDLEAQQRACEYSVLLSSRMETVRVLVTGRMPPMDYVAARKRISEAAAIIDGSSAGHPRPVPFSDTLLSLLDEDLGEARPSRLGLHGTSDQLALPAPPGSALFATSDAEEGSSERALAVSSEPHRTPEAVAETSSISNLVDREANGSDPLPDVCVSEESSRNHSVRNLPSQSPAGAEPPEMVAPPADAELTSGIVGSVELLETGFISISVKFYKEDASDLGRTRADFVVRNRGSIPLDKFVLQLAVPKYMKAEMKPATSSTIIVGGQISQSVILVNSLHGSKPVQLRFRAQFAPRGGEDMLEQGVASGLPVDL